MRSGFKEFQGREMTMASRDDSLGFDQQRIEKLEELRSSGYTVYPPEFKRKNTITEIRKTMSAPGMIGVRVA